MSAIVNAIKNFYYWISDFLSSFRDILSSIGSFIIDIFSLIYYIWYTLVIWVAKLFWYIVDWPVIASVINTFVKLSDYIWWPATVFLSALLLIAMIRIIGAFIFKLVRLWFDYNMRKTNWSKGREQTWEKSISESIDEFEWERRIFHW